MYGLPMADSSMQGVIRWETPPPARPSHLTPQRPWALVAYELRERPWDWGVIDENTANPTITARITGGRSWWTPRGSFEACVRHFDDSGLVVYARYVGTPV